MLDKSVRFLEDAFKEYYFNNSQSIHVPTRPSEREFGYQKFNSGMTRHISLKNDNELHLLLMTQVPSDVYCSNAYYSFPNLPMQEKDWKEADLIFDIDAKDLHLDCRKDHTCYKCTSCQEITNDQITCPKCHSSKFETVSTTCERCIDESTKEVKKLLEILTDDLGIKSQEISVYFSGNEGFHIHVTSKGYQNLDSRERVELADYIMFNGAIPETFGMSKQKSSKESFPHIDEKGWRGRVAKEILGSRTKRSKIIQELFSGGYSVFQLKLEDLKQRIGARIDPKVTMDIHRIFRLEGSINSKSGLSKILCKDLDAFDPFSEACLIDDKKVEAIANSPISFRLQGREFGPYVNEKVSVPKYAAVYMICKGLADVT